MAVNIMVNTGLVGKLEVMFAEILCLALVQIQMRCTSLFKDTMPAKICPGTALAEG